MVDRPLAFLEVQIAYRAGHRRVVAFDGRGNGRSDRPVGAEANSNDEFAAGALAVMDAAKQEVPGLRMIVVAGPRFDPAMLPATDPGLEIRAFVHDLYRHLAACDLAIVQGGLSTTMELTATQRPFIYFPLARHFEQSLHVDHRLKRHRAGRRMDYHGSPPDAIAAAIAEEIDHPVDHLPGRDRRRRARRRPDCRADLAQKKSDGHEGRRSLRCREFEAWQGQCQRFAAVPWGHCIHLVGRSCRLSDKFDLSDSAPALEPLGLAVCTLAPGSRSRCTDRRPRWRDGPTTCSTPPRCTPARPRPGSETSGRPRSWSAG